MRFCEAFGVELDHDGLLVRLRLGGLRVRSLRIALFLLVVFLARLHALFGVLFLVLLRLRPRLLVALLRERRDHALGEHGQVHLLLAAHVRAREREPVVDRPGVGRDQEVEVLARSVERRARGVGEPVAHRVGLAVGERVEEEPVEIGRRVLGVGEEARVGRPGVLQHERRAVERIARDARRLAGRQLQHVKRARVVREAQPLRVGRPLRPLVEAGALERDPARLALAVLRGDVERVLAALVREVRDRLAVGRPRGRALVHSGRRASGCGRRPSRGARSGSRRGTRTPRARRTARGSSSGSTCRPSPSAPASRRGPRPRRASGAARRPRRDPARAGSPPARRRSGRRRWRRSAPESRRAK